MQYFQTLPLPREAAQTEKCAVLEQQATKVTQQAHSCQMQCSTTPTTAVPAKAENIVAIEGWSCPCLVQRYRVVKPLAFIGERKRCVVRVQVDCKLRHQLPCRWKLGRVLGGSCGLAPPREKCVVVDISSCQH